MSEPALRREDFLEFTAAEAARRIEDWFRRGYVLFSDVTTHSTHLRPVAKGLRLPRRPPGRRPVGSV